ncbi:MAG: porin family protein [Bacteroidaceae bacterium]|jgi:outer membrane protein X|nr:porin family protein [Bacteroidaceae bacterium]
MKKFLMVACAMLFSAAMFAQQGEKSLGVNFKFGLDDPKSTGIGLKGQYGFTDQIRGEASFNYFLKKDHVTEFDINLNVQYVFTFGEFGVYPFAGVSLQSASPDYGDSESKFGANVGAGAEYSITEKIKLNLEFTYKTGSNEFWDRSLIGVGASYKF